MERPPGVPQAVETSTTAISLQWSPVVCAVHSPTAVAVEYMVNYELQMQQVGGGLIRRIAGNELGHGWGVWVGCSSASLPMGQGCIGPGRQLILLHHCCPPCAPAG